MSKEKSEALPVSIQKPHASSIVGAATVAPPLLLPVVSPNLVAWPAVTASGVSGLDPHTPEDPRVISLVTMTFKDRFVAFVSFLLSCNLISLVWLGLAGSLQVFIGSPVLAPFFQSDFLWLFVYAGVAGGVLVSWLRIPFRYNRLRWDPWLWLCISPVLTVFVSTYVVLGVEGLRALLGVIFLGVVFGFPFLLIMCVPFFVFGVLTGAIDIGE